MEKYAELQTDLRSENLGFDNSLPRESQNTFVSAVKGRKRHHEERCRVFPGIN